jgi:arabinofuranosyltransferase
MPGTQEDFEESWRESPFLRNAVKFGLGGVVLIFYATAVLHFDYTPDDTFIYLRFAKNIIHGGGFAFNPGEPTYGVTSPLWTLLIAAGAWMNLSPVLVAKVLDLLFASFALVIFYLLAFEVIRERLTAFLATFVFSANVWLLQSASSGMETSLSVLLVLSTVWYCMRNEYLLASAICGFLTLVRPEGFCLFLVIIGDLFLNSVDKRRAVGIGLVSVFIFFIIVGPWLVFAKLVFGTIVPNTALAKSSLHFDLGGVVSVALSTGKTIATSSILEFILAATGLVIMWRQKEVSVVRQHFLPFVWIALLIVVYAGTEADVVSRYLLLILPFIILYGFFGLKKLLEMSDRSARLSVSIVIGCAAVILIQNQYVYQVYVKQQMARFADGVEDCLTPIAIWLKENTSDKTVVVAPDVGVIGYWSERKICDLAGLITPEMKRLQRQGYTYDEMMTKHLFLPVCYPEYVVDRAPAAERLADEQFIPVMTRRFDGLSLSNLGTQFYTVYRVNAGIIPRSQLTHLKGQGRP